MSLINNPTTIAIDTTAIATNATTITNNRDDNIVAIAVEVTNNSKCWNALKSLKGCTQPKTHHPEGDVNEHTYLMVNLYTGGDLTLLWAIVLHDVGKPATRQEEDGKITFHKHDKVGADMIPELLPEMDTQLRDNIEWLVRNHMLGHTFQSMKKKNQEKLFSSNSRNQIERLIELTRLDAMGSNGDTSGVEYMGKAYEEWLVKPKPLPVLVTGKDLIKMGVQPGPQMGRLLKMVAARQKEGLLNSTREALVFVRNIVEGIAEHQQERD